MTTVMVFGTFDFLHPGHVHFLTQAKKHGTKLIVVVSRDATAAKTKGAKPTFPEADRVHVVGALRVVDEAVLGYEGDVYKIIKEHAPDVICLGYDQTHFVDKLASKLQEFKLNTKIVRLEPFAPEKYKSSKMREALARAGRPA